LACPLPLDRSPASFPRVSIVIRFYQRLWLAVDNNRIRADLVPKLFGEVFYWWHVVCFESMLSSTGWESWSDINALKDWLDRKATASQRKTWLDKATADHKDRAERARVRRLAAQLDPTKLVIFDATTKLLKSCLANAPSESAKVTPGTNWSNEMTPEQVKGMKDEDLKGLIKNLSPVSSERPDRPPCPLLR
jgi:hypothetical protein